MVFHRIVRDESLLEFLWLFSLFLPILPMLWSGWSLFFHWFPLPPVFFSKGLGTLQGHQLQLVWQLPLLGTDFFPLSLFKHIYLFTYDTSMCFPHPPTFFLPSLQSFFFPLLHFLLFFSSLSSLSFSFLSFFLSFFFFNFLSFPFLLSLFSSSPLSHSSIFFFSFLFFASSSFFLSLYKPWYLLMISIVLHLYLIQPHDIFKTWTQT